MKTIYVYRWTDDVLEDQQVIRGENDAYLEDMKGLNGAIAKL
jgi:2-haloacid dehalogenase